MTRQCGASSGEGKSFASSCTALQSAVASARLPKAAGHLPRLLPTAPHSCLQKDPEYHGQHFLGSAGGSATSSVWVTTC